MLFWIEVLVESLCGIDVEVQLTNIEIDRQDRAQWKYSNLIRGREELSKESCEELSNV